MLRTLSGLRKRQARRGGLAQEGDEALGEDVREAERRQVEEGGRQKSEPGQDPAPRARRSGRRRALKQPCDASGDLVAVVEGESGKECRLVRRDETSHLHQGGGEVQ